jgi:hypothetical protein
VFETHAEAAAFSEAHPFQDGTGRTVHGWALVCGIAEAIPRREELPVVVRPTVRAPRVVMPEETFEELEKRHLA